MTGRVLVSFDIDQTGRVQAAQIRGADAVPLLLDAALKSIRGSRFEVGGPNPSDVGPYRVTVRYCLPERGSVVAFAGTEDLKISASPKP
jgi:TonB family protein